jgi:histidinol dehydrogenase
MDEIPAEDAKWIEDNLSVKEDIMETPNKQEYKYQISVKRGEDILVVRGDNIEEMEKEVKKAKEVFLASQTPVASGSNSIRPETVSTYVCNTCGKEAFLKSGEKNGKAWKGIMCSSRVCPPVWL